MLSVKKLKNVCNQQMKTQCFTPYVKKSNGIFRQEETINSLPSESVN